MEDPKPPPLTPRQQARVEAFVRGQRRAQRNAVNRGAKAVANVRSVEEVQAEIAGKVRRT